MLKTLIVIVFLSIIASLANALYHLIKHKETSEKTVKALTFRIGISLVLFIAIAIAGMTGILQPTGIGMQMHMQKAKMAEEQAAPSLR